MSILSNPAGWLLDWFRGGSSGSVAVNARTISGIPAVWYAINKISNNFSQLPFQPMRRIKGGGAEPATDHVSFQPCKYRSNNYMNSCVFRQKLITDALLHGDGRAVPVLGGREHLPLNPLATVSLMSEGEKYHVTLPGMDDRILNHVASAATLEDRENILRECFIANRDKTIVLRDWQVLHLIGFTFDGVSGVSIIEIARQTFETALLSRKQLNKQWQNGFTGRLMLEAPQGAFRGEQDAQEFLANFKKAHTLDGDAATIGMLRENVKANVIQMSGRDAQWAEQIADSRRDIALLFLLESILGDDQSVSYNSLAEKNLAFLTNCLQNWLHKWEQECRAKLLTDREREMDSHFYRFNTGALLRTDMKTTMETLAVGIGARIYSPNDARDKIDENPYVGGDVYVNPAIDTIESSTAQARGAVLSRMRHMIGVESSRLKSSTDAKNYINWLDKFYDSWTDTFSEAVEDCGGTRELAEAHCKESKEMILEACGKQGVELSDSITAQVSDWDQRAESITGKILNKG